MKPEHVEREINEKKINQKETEGDLQIECGKA